MKAALHVGLSLVLVLAPALCCCNARWLTAAPVLPSKPVSEPQHACCQMAAHSCCHDAADESAPAPAQPSPTCGCCVERPTPAPVGPAVTVAKPAAAELLPVPAALGGTFVPTTGAARGGHDPPDRAGTDTRSAALFERHVLRC